ncbi:MAG: hypothetical protein FWB98_00765 [Defluviitaleaceae bacterium]|nr:hypothetical protein [Defluviitaleaceae bacterium]
MKKRDKLPFKELLFTYLAITKIMYWMDLVMGVGGEGFDFIGAAQAFVVRLLERDILLVLGIIAFYWLDKMLEKKKSKHGKLMEYVVFYAIGFVVLAGITAAYLGIFSLVFGPIQVGSWGAFIGYGALGYVVVAIGLNVKIYFKSRTKPDFTTNEDKIKMLKTLREGGILTQDEFNDKIDMIQGDDNHAENRR